MASGSDSQHKRWSSLFAGANYYYGFEAGPVARRAVRYHQPAQPLGQQPAGPSLAALDVGCGEGQDLLFLAERGYASTGLDFTAEGVAKAQRLLRERDHQAEALQTDLRTWRPERQYDLVIAVNSLQFLGEDAPACLQRVASATLPGGVLGLSMFAREGDRPALQGDVYFTTLAELAEWLNPNPLQPQWQMLETAQLWQWNERTNEAQPFVTLIARRRAL